MRPRIDEKRDKNGKVSSYQVRWSLRPGRGAPAQAKSFPKSKFGGDLAAARAAADKELIEKLSAFQSGEATDELRFGTVLLAQWIVAHYWRFHVPRKVKSRQSQKLYRRFIVNYIQPSFGHMRLCDVTHGMLDRWLAMLAEPCARRNATPCAACREGERCTLALPESQRDVLVTVLWSMFGYAYRSGHLLQNPAARIEKSGGRNGRSSRSAVKSRETPPDPETVEFLRRHMRPGDALYVLVRYVLGLRPAETFALIFADLLNDDLSGKHEVLIWKTVDPTTDPPSIRDLTKTEEDRKVEFADLSSRVVEEVVAELHRRNAQLSDPIFLNENGNGVWWTPRGWHTTRWLPAMQHAGLGSPGAATYFCPYQLRHTACSLWALDRRGYTLAELADQAGNSPLTLEKHYRKRFRDPQRYRNLTMDEIVRNAQAEANELPLRSLPDRPRMSVEPSAVERLALTGMKYTDIGAELGVSQSEISRVMGDLGYRKVQEGGARVLVRTGSTANLRHRHRLAIVADALERDLGVRAIAKDRHTSATTVKDILFDAGWRRTQGRGSRWIRIDDDIIVVTPVEPVGAPSASGLVRSSAIARDLLAI